MCKVLTGGAAALGFRGGATETGATIRVTRSWTPGSATMLEKRIAKTRTTAMEWQATLAASDRGNCGVPPAAMVDSNKTGLGCQ